MANDCSKGVDTSVHPLLPYYCQMSGSVLKCLKNCLRIQLNLSVTDSKAIGARRFQVAFDYRFLTFMAMGDAYAAALEFLRGECKQKVLEECLLFEKFVRHPTHGYGRNPLEPGCYTDDTEMAIANTRALVAHGSHCTKEQFADAWVQEFHANGRRPGYSRGFHELLSSATCGADLIRVLRPDSDKNGAAMRAIPFAVCRDLKMGLALSKRQAEITHNTEDGIFASQMVTAISHFFAYTREPVDGLSEFLSHHVPGANTIPRFSAAIYDPWKEREIRSYKDEGISLGLATVWAVRWMLTSLRGYDDRKLLIKTMELGGDTDTVAAIIFGIIVHRAKEYGDNGSNKLPSFMWLALEGNKMIRSGNCCESLNKLANELIAAT